MRPTISLPNTSNRHEAIFGIHDEILKNPPIFVDMDDRGGYERPAFGRSAGRTEAAERLRIAGRDLKVAEPICRHRASSSRRQMRRRSSRPSAGANYA